MSNCAECGHSNPEAYSFCEECGRALGSSPGEPSSVACGGCGHANPADYGFCEECGTRLPTATSEPEPEPEPEPVSESAEPEPEPEPEAEPGPVAETRCPVCAHANPAGYAFCEECGAALIAALAAVVPDAGEAATVGCPGCGHANPAAYGFCEECGMHLTAAPGPVVPVVAAVPEPEAAQLAAASPAGKGGSWRRYAAAAVVVAAVGGGITAAVLNGGSGGSGDTTPPGASDTTYAPETTAAPGSTAGTTGTSGPATTQGSATTSGPEATTLPGTTAAPTTTAVSSTAAPATTTTAEFSEAEADLFQQAMEASSNQSLSRPPDPPTIYGLVGNGLRRDYDADFDGLSDYLEDFLIKNFKPYYVFDEEETGCIDPNNEMELLFQVSPVTTPTTYLDTSTHVAITVVATYTADCGMFGLSALGFPEMLTEAHNGDNERIVIHVTRPNSDSDAWSIDYIEVNRHFDPVTQIRYGNGPEFPTLRNSDDWSTAVQTIAGNNRFLYLHDWIDYDCCHPVLYVSESKHAVFPTVMACEFYSTKIPEKLVDDVNPLSWFEDLVNMGIGLFTDERINIYVDDWTTRYASQLTQLGIILLEDCGGGPQVFPDVPPSQNVGEVNASGLTRQAFDRMSDSESSAIRNLFGNPGRRVETTWTDADFCGGNVRSYSGCGGSMAGKWMHTQAVRLDPKPGVTVTTEEPEEVVAWIDDVWFEHNQVIDGRNGMWVHVPLGVTNHFDNLNIRIAAFVYDLDGNKVNTTGDAEYHTSSGDLTSQHIEATGTQFESTGWDQKLFLPYDQFYPGQQDYKTWLEVTWEETGETLASEWSGGTFKVTRPGMLDGVWYSDINGGWVYDMWQNPDDPTGNSYYFAPRGIGEQGIIYLDGYNISAQWSATNGSYYGSGDAWIASTSNQLPSRIEWDHGGSMWRP